MDFFGKANLSPALDRVLNFGSGFDRLRKRDSLRACYRRCDEPW